ncbi:hypothetical protein COO60DRAFT_944613 [Scenedesmus sp. NREL 46B-D3]|nr:hypothetical protein COO60DRAFT_944613 [Scenedesmus sp. NREL 46B-D3]
MSYYGGVATVYNAPFHMTNSRLTNNVSPWASLYLSNPATALLDGCVWLNNSGYQAGAVTAYAYPDTASEIKFSNCRFDGNRASQQGGAVWSKNANLTFVNSSCVGNNALVGGCLHAAGTPNSFPTHVTFGGCQLLNNTAQQSAGAVWFDTIASAVLHDTNVSFNAAKLSAGAIYYHGSSGSLANVTMHDNAAHSAGGVMLEGVGAELAVATSLFISNKAADRAGAVQILQGSINLVNSSLTGNIASSAAGGIFLQDGATLSCKQCTLQANRAAVGAAIAAEASTIQLAGTSVLRNVALGELVSVPTAAGQQPAGCGAGIWADSSVVKLTSSRFDSNQADLQGGAIHATNSSIIGTGSSFVGNQAHNLGRQGTADLQGTSGGAIHASVGPAAGSLQLHACDLSTNVAGTGGAIAAVASRDTNSQQVAGSTSAAAAGRVLQQARKLKQHAAIVPASTDQAYILLEDTRGFNNSATAGSGGGLFCSSPGVFVNITNSSFSSNSAVQSGGGMALLGPASVLLQGSSLALNAASSCGGLLLLHPKAASEIIRSSFDGNVAALGTGRPGSQGTQGSSSSSSSSSNAESTLGQLPDYNSTGSGGGLCLVLAGAPVTISDGIMTENTALHGGRLRLQRAVICKRALGQHVPGCDRQPHHVGTQHAAARGFRE